MEDARFIISKKRVLEQYNTIKRYVDAVSYSLKTNPLIGRILEKESNSMFSAVAEESHIINDKSRIWLLAQAQMPDDFKQLLKAGIRRFIVDNEPDLARLLSSAKRCNAKIELLLRLRLKEHTLRTERYFVFGFSAGMLSRILYKLKDSQTITKLGIHFHRKTQNIAEWSMLNELKESISDSVLKFIDIVNIGGGIPCAYKNSRFELDPIFRKIKEMKMFLNEFGIQMLAEPGRFIAAPSVRLEARIINIYDNNIVVNCSVYNSAMDSFIVPIRLLVQGELREGQGKAYVIKGCTPCSLDIFRYRVYLNNPKIGDRIVFLNAGAYNFAADFCGLRKLKSIIVDDF